MATIAFTETVIWTTLPTAVLPNGDLTLSVFVSPRLGTSNNSTQPLSDWPDWVNWPSTISTIAFTVSGLGGDPVGARIVTAEALDSTGWQAMFGASTTSVVPWEFNDYSGTPKISYDMAGDHSIISGLYGAIGAGSPTSPIEIVKGRRTWSPVNQNLDDIFDTLLSIGSPAVTGGPGPLADLLSYYNRPDSTATDSAFTPTVDFHQGLGALGSFPVLMRSFGLVFDLQVTPRTPITSAETVKITVNPRWSSSNTNIVNVSLPTSANLSATSFLPTPLGTKDYLNGMLDVADTTRFSVTGADVDLAGMRLFGLRQALETIFDFDTIDDLTEGSTAAVTVPALRSTGPTLVWSGFADQLTTLATAQAALQTALTAHLTPGGAAPPPLPTVFAEHVIRGHRIDVLTESPDASPAWRSLMGRFGTYSLGSETVTAVDEGVVVPSGATAGTDDPQVSDALYISERLARWNGWGLAAQFTGNVLDNADDGSPDPVENPGNPTVSGLPQLSAYFQAPNLGRTFPNPFPFPKLRFGNSYKFRARSADLAGNSVPVSSTDATTATADFLHLRYEPVRPPVLVHTAPLTTGESTFFLVLLDDQVHPPTPNGRWLFPPKTAPMMAEQHGEFDSPSDGTLQTSAYSVITPRDAAIITDATNIQLDTTNGDVNPTPYISAPLSSTPWLPDPISAGAALLGVPGAAAGTVVQVAWPATSWPDVDPALIVLEDGGTPSFTQVPGVGATSSPVLQIQLPKAESATVRISSSLSSGALGVLGVWDWIAPLVGQAVRQEIGAQALAGQVWLMTPYATLRMVHAVRVPLLGPRLQKPTTFRQPGVTSVDISDDDFSVDENSTSVVDFEANWTDPYDDPTDPDSDPGDPAKSTRTFSGPAFRLQVPDPNPIGPDAQPMTISEPVQVFAFAPEDSGGTAGSTHHIGDTKHHTIYYTATGSSRFAELFQTSASQTFDGTNPLPISTAALGINPQSVVITPVGGGDALVLDEDFTVDVAAGTISLTSGSSSQTYDVTYQPTITLSGPAVPVEVLSSTRPSAPHIARIRPAWEIVHTDHATVKEGRAEVQRTGGYLRVFLERPWFTSGAHEMVGVVTQTAAPITPTPVSQLPLTTTMGLDPITYTDAKHKPWPLVPTLFDRLGDVPVVAGRSLYDSPPRLGLAEDPSGTYKIWPYPVHYDEVSQQWFADVRINPGVTSGGTYPPPPGYFVRLAIVRFQPYSLEGYELSPLTLATIAQPVPNRFVTVIADHKDKSHKTVLVTVIGPGYHGWRPPLSTAATQADAKNPYSPQVYSKGTAGHRHSSTMAVDVQVHDTSTGLEGDLAWRSVTAPVRLPVTFSDETAVEWGGEPRLGRVELPVPITSAKKMRLRISELDFYPDGRLPTEILNAQRRPFVTFVPVN